MFSAKIVKSRGLTTIHINILAVGRLKERYLVEAQQEYLKRLRAYAKVNVVEVPDEAFGEGFSRAEGESVKEKEAQRLMKQIKPGTYTVALDREGRQLSSEELARWLGDLALQGKSEMAFVIGGTLGLSTRIIREADFRLSFSMLTFPHQLMRVLLLEQVFRAFKILKGEPYHK